ncbi:kinase-like protein [Thelephora ganbajun]|uniref:Kinase-like protein n=1 Tax=Thelephora ganbajun TaxID=370292 RepID=A0ACB6Z413_THEGA|nr:kinase-like protein [Thelephora ganbajun]
MVEVFKYLSSGDAQAFVNVVDEMLDNLPQQIYRSCLRHLYRICGHHVLLPKSLQIPLCYDPANPAHYGGGFADVWKGRHNDLDVAAKALRVYSKDDLEKTRRRFCKEVMTWRTLSHPNVLPLLGVTMAKNQFVMVSQWMDSGNINEFLKRSNSNVDRLQLVREITAGLAYMHDRGIIHGDLKGDNIMIDKDGHARLADFSLITLIPDQSKFVSTCIESGTFLWMSPELLDPESFSLKGICPTKESDCYALGMVVYETLSGQVPFGKRGGPFAALSKVLGGERPARPQGEGGKLITDDIWEVVELCWRPQPSDRAIANDVLECLGGTHSPTRPPFKIDRDAETDSDDQSDAASDDS